MTPSDSRLGAAPISTHTIVIESPTLIAVVPDYRYCRAGMQVGAVVDHKELQNVRNYRTPLRVLSRSIYPSCGMEGPGVTVGTSLSDRSEEDDIVIVRRMTV
jgi:hypothetical protein